METKKCIQCGKELPIAEFNNNTKSKDGLHSYCRACQKVNRKDYYSKHKKELIQKSKDYRVENKEAVTKYKKEYYTKNKDKIKEKYKNDKLYQYALANQRELRNSKIKATRLDGRKNYKIKIDTNSNATANYITRRAKLIQQTNWLFIFEYRGKFGEPIRTSINKVDYLNNKNLIEAC